jgi:hypothetical protein
MKQEASDAIDRFLEQARASGMIDLVRSSAFVMMVDPDKADLRMALQIGVAVLYGKPLLLVTHKGEKIPQRARDVADEIVELASNDLNHPENQAKIVAAIVRLTDKIKAQERRENPENLE